MRNRLRLLLCAGAFALSLPARSESATPNETEEARHFFDQGLEHFRREEFDAAIADFEAAFHAKPHPAVLFNLGRAYASAMRPADAARVLEQYLADEGDKLSPSRRAAVSNLLAKQRQRLGTLSVISDEPGVSVSVDGIAAGETPLLPISASSGSHVVLGTRDGYTPVVFPVKVVATQETTVTLKLEPLPTPAIPESTASHEAPLNPRTVPSTARASPTVHLPPVFEEPRSSTLGQIGVASVGVGVAAGALGSYFAIRAHNSWSERMEHCSAGGCDEQAVEAWKDAKRSAFAADASFAGALIAIGSGIYLLVSEKPSSRHAATTLTMRKIDGSWLAQLGGRL